jgi:hypothetical protein
MIDRKRDPASSVCDVRRYFYAKMLSCSNR